MRKVQSLVYGGINSKDYNVGVHGQGTFKAPERAVEIISIPGRNGDIIIDGGRFENQIINYHCYIIKKFTQNMDDFRAKIKSLIGYQRIEDTFHPDEYREGILIDSIEPSIYGKASAGEFDLNFNCKPQRWLKSGEKALSLTGGIIKNPTDFPAKPLIRAYGTGTFTVNGIQCKINTANVYTDIDCENEDAYKGTANCNPNVYIPQYPILAAGNNQITLQGISRLEITPKWYKI